MNVEVGEQPGVVPPQPAAFQVKSWMALVVIVAAIAVLWWIGFFERGVPADAYVKAFDANDTLGAIALADATLAKRPTNVEALVQKAFALAQQGSLTFRETEFGEQAIAVAEEALEINPQSDEAWRAIGYSNEIMQKYAAAHEAYEKALAINPENMLAISQDAHAYDLEGNMQKAEAGYRKALKGLDLDQAHLGLGRILVQQGAFDDAQAEFEKAVETSSNRRVRAEAHYSVGIIELIREDRIKAQQQITLATQEDPTYALAWVGLGMVLFSAAVESEGVALEARNASITQSFDALEKAIGLNQNQAAAYFQIGKQLGAIGKIGTAEKILTETKAVIPKDITLSAPAKALMLEQVDAALSVIASKKR